MSQEFELLKKSAITEISDDLQSQFNSAANSLDASVGNKLAQWEADRALTESGDFDTGFTATERQQIFLYDGEWYRWDGALPKTVAASSTPASTGGVCAGAWVSVGDAALRSALTTDAIGKGIDLVANGFRKGIIQGEPAPIYGITTIDHADESTDRRVMGIIDGVLYACSGTAIYTSTDMGDTWNFLRNFTGRIQKILPCDDGEILYSNGGSSIYKSSGWATNPATATFSAVVTLTGAGVLRWGFDGDGTKFIATHYDAVTRANSRYAYISTDGGDTWSLVWDSAVQFPDDHTDTHIHAACYDPYNDRFFLNEGHKGLGMWYSDDNGTTWNMVPDSDTLFPESTPTTMTATPYGIVCGTDSFPDGVWLIKGASADTLELKFIYHYRNATTSGLVLQCDVSVTDPETGMVYIGARGFSSNVPSVIMACNGESANVVYESPNNKPIYNLAVSGGKVFAEQGGSPYRSLKGRVSVIGSRPEKMITNGNILTDNIVPNRSMAVGYGSDAQQLRGVAVGYNVKVGTVGGEDSVALGRNVTIETGQKNIAIGNATAIRGVSGDFSTVVGSNIDVTSLGYTSIFGFSANVTRPTNSAFGALSSAGGSSSCAFGYESKTLSGNSVAVGNSATAGVSPASGFDSTAVGNSSSATGTASTAVGKSASATGNYSSAFGASASANATFSCAFGSNSSATGGRSLAVGYGAIANAVEDAIAIGGEASSTGDRAIAIGRQASAKNSQSIAIGRIALAQHDNSVALGSSAQTQRANSVCIGNRHIESTLDGGRIYLKSPDGTLYYISVDNSGALTVTAV